MDFTKKQYSVKEISKLCNLTRRQLLYYEDKGLILGVERDLNNNYRYYTQEHLFRLVFIKELREIGFSIEDIAYLLANNKIEVLTALVRQGINNARLELNKSLANYEKCTERYNSLLEATYICGNKPEAGCQEDFTVIVVPEKNVIELTYEGFFEDDPFLFFSKFAVLDAALIKYNLTKISPKQYVFCNHFHFSTGKFLKSKNEIKLRYEVNERLSDCTYFTKTASFKCVSAICIIHGYDELEATYCKMFEWSRQQGLILENSSYEESLLDIGFSDFAVSKLHVPIVTD